MRKLMFFWKELMATFWFLPVLILLFAVLFSMGVLYLDSFIVISDSGWERYFLVNSSDSARSILSSISTAMIGVAGTVFSVTLVALTLASSQFGPRLIRNFMYVRLNQVVLGSYVSTYLYCLLVLSAVKAGNGYTFIPSISILVAIFAAIANIILLIVFIHRIAMSIQADEVISDISDFISRQVETLFPEKMGAELEEKETTEAASIISTYKNTTVLESPESGYIQYIASEALVDVVSKQEAILQLDYRPGSFLVKGQKMGLLYSNEPPEEGAVGEIFNQFVLGKTKTAQQDLEFSIHQMVEIASRALSPGINDPYTAIACIDNLVATMCYLAEARFPSKYRFDEEGHLRVIADTVTFEGVLDAAFNQIRQFSRGSTAVIIRLMEAMITIHGFTVKEAHKKAVIKHAKMILILGKQTIKEPNDIEDLTERANKILKDV